MDGRRIQAAARRASRQAGQGDLVAFAVRAGVSVDDVARSDRARVVWDARRAEALSPEIAVGFGEAARVELPEGGALREAAAAAAGLFRRVSAVGHAEPRAFGAFAFEPGRVGAFAAFGDGSLLLPRVTVRQRGTDTPTLCVVVERAELARPERIAEEVTALLSAPAPSRRLGRPRGRVLSDGRATFERSVSRALAAISEGVLEKVVLARAALVETTATAASLLEDLAEEPGCVRFCLRQAGAAFVGATPEVLVAKRGREVRAEVVAGSEPRRGQELAETARLLGRAKDQAEHRIAMEAIRAALVEAGCELHVDETRVRSLARIHHLVTPVRGRAPEGASVLGLGAILHPTPAVGGVPRAAALALMAREEEAPRGLYAGPLGWIGASGDGELVVAIRSALVEGARATAFAGAGIVDGSLPELEARETDVKLSTMLAALGVETARRSHPAAAARRRRSEVVA